MQRTSFWMLRYGAMSTNGNGDAIIAMPCGKWCPRFRKDFAHEMLYLRMKKKDRVRYGRRYSVFLWRPAFPTPTWQGVSSGDGIWEIRTCFHIAVETFLTSRAHFEKRRKATRTKRLCGSTWGATGNVFHYLGLEMPRASLICFETVKNITWIWFRLVHPSCTVRTYHPAEFRKKK